MAPNPRRIDQRLQALYDRVPAIDCKGHCHDACCFVDASIRERQRLRSAAGRDLDTDDALKVGGTRFDAFGQPLARYRCTMLTESGRCGVYEHRPMICRLFGVAERLECEYGCVPERMLTFAEGVELLAEAMHVGGTQPDAAWPQPAEVREAVEREHELLTRFIAKARVHF